MAAKTEGLTAEMVWEGVMERLAAPCLWPNMGRKCEGRNPARLGPQVQCKLKRNPSKRNSSLHGFDGSVLLCVDARRKL